MFRIGLVLTVAVLSLSSELWAFNTPLKAKGIKGSFVTAYADCTSPSMTVPPYAIGGCTPVPEDPTCQFGPSGSGKFGFTVSGSDIKTKVTMVGLACPPGTQLVLTGTYKVTTGNCSAGDCTSQTYPDFPFGGCTVDAGGKCKWAGTWETLLAQPILPDTAITELEIGTINLFNNNTLARSFTAGLRSGPASTMTTTTTTSTTTSSTTTTTTLPCEATTGGFCWYAGATAADCNTTCANAGKVYDTATGTYAGSGGTDANCTAVATDLGFGVFYGSGAVGAGVGCYEYSAAITIRDTDPTTAAGTNLSSRRACACQ